MFVILLLVAWLGLLLNALAGIVRAEERAIRTLRRRTWVLLVVLLPFAGAVAWFVLGRPRRARPAVAAHARPLGPDDDEEYLESLARRIAHRRTDPDDDHPTA